MRHKLLRTMHCTWNDCLQNETFGPIFQMLNVEFNTLLELWAKFNVNILDNICVLRSLYIIIRCETHVCVPMYLCICAFVLKLLLEISHVKVTVRTIVHCSPSINITQMYFCRSISMSQLVHFKVVDEPWLDCEYDQLICALCEIYLNPFRY